MNNKLILMVFLCIVLGMLVANMFKDVCGCNVVEGQCGRSDQCYAISETSDVSAWQQCVSARSDAGAVNPADWDEANQSCTSCRGGTSVDCVACCTTSGPNTPATSGAGSGPPTLTPTPAPGQCTRDDVDNSNCQWANRDQDSRPIRSVGMCGQLYVSIEDELDASCSVLGDTMGNCCESISPSPAPAPAPAPAPPPPPPPAPEPCQWNSDNMSGSCVWKDQPSRGAPNVPGYTRDQCPESRPCTCNDVFSAWQRTNDDFPNLAYYNKTRNLFCGAKKEALIDPRSLERQRSGRLAVEDWVETCCQWTPIDCNGVPNGDAVVDECGVCGGDNSSCAGCDGRPNSGLVNDECGVCGGPGIPDGHCDCDGNILDECGVCDGNNSTCLGCDGVPNSGLVNDECDVCGGTGIPEGKCDCNGNVLDICGVCGGDNSTCPGPKYELDADENCIVTRY